MRVLWLPALTRLQPSPDNHRCHDASKGSHLLGLGGPGRSRASLTWPDHRIDDVLLALSTLQFKARSGQTAIPWPQRGEKGKERGGMGEGEG